jgi:hypothetical protein
VTIESKFRDLRSKRLELKDRAVPSEFQGISKAKIRQVLSKIDQAHQDNVDVVFALLDDETNSMFSSAQYNSKFTDGATVAHIGAHVGILQRGGLSKLDREGRDYWIKPLRELGAIEPIYLNPDTNEFILGHPKPKSPNSAYRLSSEFIEILKSPEGEWQSRLENWIKEERIRERAKLQALAQSRSEQIVAGDHKDLIIACQEIYVSQFLDSYELLFVDYEDGERITLDEQHSLAEAGLSLELGDAMPDLLLWNPSNDALWVIEAVTSDGEVDEHKVKQVLDIVRRSGKSGAGFTTAYNSWNDAAARQGRYKNIAPSTYIWIKEDPAKHYLVSELVDELTVRGLNE